MATNIKERIFGNHGGGSVGVAPSRIRFSPRGREIRIVDPDNELTIRPGIFKRVASQAAIDVGRGIKRFIAEKAPF